MDRMTESVLLSDGRKVLVQELTAMDGMSAKKVLNAKSTSDMMQIEEVLVCFSIQQIDGSPFTRPTMLVGVQGFMSTIKAKDFRKIQAAYKNLNEESDEGEASAAN